MDKSLRRREWPILLLVLRQVRREAGLRQVDLAERLGRPQSLVSDLESGQRRLDVVELRTICHALGLPLEEFIRRWDRPGTLFYLDPPYWGTEHFYGRGLFGRDQFEQLSAALQGLQGRFILSLNDVPEVRELFAWATIETVELSYQAGGAKAAKRVREVIIS